MDLFGSFGYLMVHLGNIWYFGVYLLDFFNFFWVCGGTFGYLLDLFGSFGFVVVFLWIFLDLLGILPVVPLPLPLPAKYHQDQHLSRLYMDLLDLLGCYGYHQKGSFWIFWVSDGTFGYLLDLFGSFGKPMLLLGIFWVCDGIFGYLLDLFGFFGYVLVFLGIFWIFLDLLGM